MTAETPRTDERTTLTEADWDALTEASFRGGSAAWRAEIERILTDRLAAAVARAEAAEAKVAAALALCGDYAVFADFGEPPNEDVVAGVREADLLAALGSATTEGPPSRLRAAGGDRMTPNSLRAHNHAPYRPSCDEREVSGRVRGACLNDDGSDR